MLRMTRSSHNTVAHSYSSVPQYQGQPGLPAHGPILYVLPVQAATQAGVPASQGIAIQNNAQAIPTQTYPTQSGFYTQPSS